MQSMEQDRTPPARLRGLCRSRRTVMAGVLGVAAACAAPRRVAAQARIVLRLSHVVAPGTAKGPAALEFARLAEARSDGRVRVEVYPDSTLYKDREELEAWQLGAVQMLAPSLSKLALVGGPEFELFDLPYLFADRAAFRRLADGPMGASLMRKLEARGVKGLAYWDNGFKVVTANRALRRPADCRGLVMRVQSSRVISAQIRALGAEPKVLALGDTAAALREGLVDSQEGIASNIATQRIFTLQRHLTLTHHAYLAYAVIVNQRFWDGLPAEVRTLLAGALQDATRFGDALAARQEAQASASPKRVASCSAPVNSVRTSAGRPSQKRWLTITA